MKSKRLSSPAVARTLLTSPSASWSLNSGNIFVISCHLVTLTLQACRDTLVNSITKRFGSYTMSQTQGKLSASGGVVGKEAEAEAVQKEEDFKSSLLLTTATQ